MKRGKKKKHNSREGKAKERDAHTGCKKKKIAHFPFNPRKKRSIAFSGALHLWGKIFKPWIRYYLKEIWPKNIFVH